MDVTNLRHHFFDARSIEEPRSNYVRRKRKWQAEPELFPGDHTQAHSEVSDIQVIPDFENPHRGEAASFEGAQITEKFME